MQADTATRSLAPVLLLEEALPRAVADSQDAPAAAPHPRRSAPGSGRLKLLIGLIAIWFVVYLATYVPAGGNGSDFQVFYAGASADARGIDPFSWNALWRVEQTLFYGGLGRVSSAHFAPYGDAPPFALLLRPLAALPFADAYRLWALLLFACSALGVYLYLERWPRRIRIAAGLIVAVSPAVLFNVRLGQNSAPLLLALGLAQCLLARRRPYLAGLALSLGFFKPHLMLPVALIACAAAPRGSRRPALLGLLAGLGAWLAIGIAFEGGFGVFGRWWSSVSGFAGSIRYQPDVASIPGLYYAQAPDGLIHMLNLVCLVLAATLILGLAFAARSGEERARARLFGGGIAVYFSLSPYVHTSDQALLALPLLALIGPQGRGLRDSAVWLAAIAATLAPIVVFRDYHTVGINALPPLCLALAYALGAPGARAQVAESADTMRAGHPESSGAMAEQSCHLVTPVNADSRGHTDG